MKVRQGFVSNSSSTSFYITNKTKSVKTIVDFVKEVKYLVKGYREEYQDEVYDKATQTHIKIPLEEHEKRLIDCAESRENNFWSDPQQIWDAIKRRKYPDEVYWSADPTDPDRNKPHSNVIFKGNAVTVATYGDDDGDIVGIIFDYMLRNGGETKSFRWGVKEYLR